ncbi:MAG: hypothetical protein ACM3PP_08865 [Candidatus Saccharibacteria bacterium]
MKRFNSFLVFMFAFLPGAGYMYMGLMRKGLEAMMLVFGCIFVFNWIDLGGLAAVIAIPLWFYFFFDTFLVRRKLEQNEEVDEDGLINMLALLGENKLYYIGIGLVVIGVLATLNNLSMDLSGFWQYFDLARKYVPSLLLIAGGIFLLTRNRRSSIN